MGLKDILMKNTFTALALAGAAAAQTIQRGCLMETDDVGHRKDDNPHYDTYLRSNFSNADVPSSYRIYSIYTCMSGEDDDGGRMRGFTFVMADPADPSPNDSGNWLVLPMMGIETDNCVLQTIDGSIDYI